MALAAQEPQHKGTRLEGYATVVEPDRITVLDDHNQVFQILTSKDYTSQVPAATPVRVWYTTEGGANHLEDLVIIKSVSIIPTSPLTASIKRIIILPQVEGVENSEGLISAMGKYLADNTGWYVGPPDLALEIGDRVRNSSPSLDALDPTTGDFDMERYLAAQGSLAALVASRTHSDAVLVVRVVKVRVGTKGSVASWDGITEPVKSHKSFLDSPPWEKSINWVFAATTVMNLWSQTGNLLWQNRRGFAVVAVPSGKGSKLQERPLTNVYNDQGFMQHWLEGALGPLTSPNMGAAGEPVKLSPEVQEQIDKIKQAGEEGK